MADDITIQIQENPSLTISVNTDADLLLSASQSCPLTDWSTIQSKPDFDSLYYPTSNPSGYVSSGLFATQSGLNQTGQYLLSVNTSTSGALRSSISILESATGGYYSSTNPSGFITGAVVRPNTYLLVDSSSLDSINWQTRQLSFEGLQSISWADRIAYDATEDPSIDWANRELVGEWATQTDPSTNYSLVNLGFLQSYAYPASNPSGFATGIDASNFVLKSQTGQFYASSNPSGYVTGLVVRPTETGSFISASQTGAFYPRSNPSGFITGVDTSLLVLKSETGAYTGLFYPLTANPSGYLTSSALSTYATQLYVNSVSGVIRTDISAIQSLTGGFVTGSVVRPNETGDFLTSGSLSSYATTGYVNAASGVIRSDISLLQTATGLLYPRTNPSGYITGIDTSSFVTVSQTGSYTGAFYPLSLNPSGYVTGSVIRPADTGAFYPASNPSGFATGIDASNFVLKSETGSYTGIFYPYQSNPNGYINSGSLSLYATQAYVNSSSGVLRSDISNLQSATGSYYLNSNPSGYITGFNSGLYVLASSTGALTGEFYPLVSNPSGYVTGSYYTKSEILSLFQANLPFYFTSQPSDVNGYPYMTRSAPTGTRSTGVFTNVLDGGYLTGFITQSGYPNVSGTFIGNNVAGIHCKKGNSAQKPTSLYYQILKYDISGQSTLLNTSDASEELGILDAHIYVPYYLTGMNLNSSDRIILKWFARVSGPGANPDITLVFDGDSSSSESLPFANDLVVSSFVMTGQTGAYTGEFYPRASNPSGYLTSSSLSSYATQSYVNSASGVIRADISGLQAATGNYYLSSNPSGFVTGSVVRPTDTGSFVTTGFGATGYYPRLANPSGYVTGIVIRASDTGDFYPRSNPSGYTGTNDYHQLGSRAVPYASFGENIDKLIAFKSTGDKRLFSTFDHVAPSYVKNVSGIWKDIDFTCCSVWNSDYGQEKGGTAITPSHVAFAYHFPIATGSTLRFVTDDNQIVTRTLTGALRLGSTDVIIGGLDTPLPSSIRPAQVPPSGFQEVLLLDRGARSCGVFFNKAKLGSVTEISLTTPSSVGLYSAPSNPSRLNFYGTPELGDSGGGTFLLAGNQPIFLGSIKSSSQFDWIAENITGVNSILSQLGGGYSLSLAEIGHYAVSELIGSALKIHSKHQSSIYGDHSDGVLILGNDGVGDAIRAYSYSGIAMDIWSIHNTAIQANTLDSTYSIATFGLNFQKQLEITSNGSLYFTQQSNTISSSGKLLTGESAVLDWVNLSLSQQWLHPSVATTSGHIVNYHALTGYAYPRATNPSEYVTGSVVRPTDTGAFLTSSQITGAGTVSSYLSGSVIVLSGAAGGGGLTQGQADALYYPLTGNPSGFATGSVVRPSETGSFVTTSQTGTLTGAFYPLGANPSGYVTGNVVRPSETGSFATTGIITGAGNITVSAGGGNLIISGSSSSSSATKIMGFVFDGGGSVLETGAKTYIRAAHAGTFYRISMLADITGSAIVDIYKDTWANYPPTAADSIAVSGKPTISNGIKMESAVFTGWTTSSFASGDVLAANLDSCSGITRLTLELEYTT